MIKQINDEEVLNDISKLLFNTELSKNPYSKFIAYDENKIIGFANYDLIYERCELIYIGILPEYRNKKLASKLMEFIIEDCKNKKIKNISLEVNINNKNAIKLYEKYDFKVEAIRNNYYNGEDAYLMVKELSD